MSTGKTRAVVRSESNGNHNCNQKRVRTRVF